MCWLQMAHLQERINMLQQHEANGQCLGGVLCLLQSPIYNAGSLESFLHVRFYGHPHNSPPYPRPPTPIWVFTLFWQLWHPSLQLPPGVTCGFFWLLMSLLFQVLFEQFFYSFRCLFYFHMNWCFCMWAVNNCLGKIVLRVEFK